jgi:hypothetical protein
MADNEDRVGLILGVAAVKRDALKYREARTEASSKLIEDFLALAERKGFHRDTSTRGEPCFAYVKGTQTVRFLIDVHDGQIDLRAGTGSESTEAERVPLEFNVTDGMLVGTTVDYEVATAPGHLSPRVPALVVLAREVAKALAPADGSKP